MIDDLARLIDKYWDSYRIGGACDTRALSFTKFCQRIVGHHTKVLFFVTYRGAPLCIIKTVRFPEFSDALRNEARAQSSAPRTTTLSAPRVLWEDVSVDRAVYAEEYIDSAPVSVATYSALQREIVVFSGALPHAGTVRADRFISDIKPHLPTDTIIARHRGVLEKSSTVLELGMTHGDLGRQNILGTKSQAWIVDWERSGDIPFRYFDAVTYFMRLYRGDVNAQLRAVQNSLTLDKEGAETILAVTNIYMSLYKKYPDAYQEIVKIGRSMVP